MYLWSVLLTELYGIKIWDEPGNSTKGEEYFARERIIVPQLAWPIANYDRSFLAYAIFSSYLLWDNLRP